MSSVIKIAALIATGQALSTGAIPTKIAALTQGVMKSMLLTKLKTITVLLVMLSMVTLTSVIVLAWGPAAGQGNGVEKPAAKALANNVPVPEKDAVQPDADAGPKELDPKIIAAWKRAGADFALLSDAHSVSFPVVGSGPEKQGDLPFSHFEAFPWTPGLVANLPQPQRAFGLSLAMTYAVGSPVTDGDLKELAGLKHLQRLHLVGAVAITDVGLKELAGLTNLRMLSISGGSYTDSGLKELADAESFPLIWPANLYSQEGVFNEPKAILFSMRSRQRRPCHDG